MYRVSLAEVTLLNKVYTSMSDNVFYECAKFCGNSNFLGLREDPEAVFRKYVIKNASYVKESCHDNILQKTCMDVVCVRVTKLSVRSKAHLFL